MAQNWIPGVAEPANTVKVQKMDVVSGPVVGAFVRTAIQWLRESQEGRPRVDQLLKPLSGKARAAGRRWLEDPRVVVLLVSEDEEQHRQAELLLRDAIRKEGGDEPEGLDILVRGASHLIVEKLPPTPEIREVLRRVDARHEQMLEAVLEGFASLQPQRTPDRLHPRVVRSLERVERQSDARDTGAFLDQVPSRAGFDQHVTRQEECTDPHLWEALGSYAGLRSWHDAARQAFEFAAKYAAHPERLQLWAVWHARHQGIEGETKELLSRIEASSGAFCQAVRAAVDDRTFSDVDGLTFEEPEHIVCALVAIDTMVGAKDDEAALALVRRWRGADSTPTPKAVEAHLHRIRAERGPAAERLGELEAALQLSLEAWQETQAFGLPAPLAARTAVEAASELSRPEAVRDVIGIDNPYRSEEFRDPLTASFAQLSIEILQEGGDLGDRLSAFDQAAFPLLRPLILADDAPRPPLNELLKLLELAESETDTTRALLILAQSGHLHESEELERLRQTNSAQYAMVEAAFLSSTGDVEGAVSKLRPLAAQHSGAATTIVNVYHQAGRHLDAADAALSVWERYKDPRFLTFAAGMLADPPLVTEAPDALVERLRQAYVEAQASLNDPERVGALLESLVVIHVNRSDFQKAATYANSLHGAAPRDHSRWRVALCQTALGNHEEAWATLVRGSSLPQPRNDVEVRLGAALVQWQSDEPAHVESLLEWADLTSTPDLQATVLLTCQQILDRCRADEALGKRVWEAISAFTDAHPDSTVIRVFKLDEDDPIGSIARQLPQTVRKVSETERQFGGHILTGRFPYTFASLVSGKSPALLLAERGTHPLHAPSGSLIRRQAERRTARAALGQAVAVDISTVAVLAELERCGCVDLTAYLQAYLPSVTAQDVASHSKGPVGVGALTPTSDPLAPVVFVDLTEADQQLQADRQQAMGVAAGRLQKQPVVGPLTVVDRTDITDREYIAWAGGEAAYRSGVPLWVDDAALRDILRPVGVRAFSTRGLADVLLEGGRITGEEHQAIRDAMRAAWITDLPATIGEVITRVGSSGADPTDVLAFRTGGWWRIRRHGLLSHWIPLFTELLEHDAAVVPEWFGNACVGLALGRSPASSARLLLMLAGAVPELRPIADELAAAANAHLWCVPAQLTAVEVVQAAEALAREGDSTPGQVIDVALGSSEIGQAARRLLSGQAAKSGSE